MKMKDIKILLVDDDDDDCLLFQEAMKEVSPDAEVVVISRWQQALASIKNKRRPDIIFLDYLLPGIRGNELATEFHNVPRLKDIPILLTSGMPEFDESSQKDIKEVIQKPSSFPELVKQLRKVIEKYLPFKQKQLRPVVH
jgi:CheY-like chemotaxis protein